MNDVVGNANGTKFMDLNQGRSLGVNCQCRPRAGF